MIHSSSFIYLNTFSTLKNLLSIALTYYYPSGCLKSNMCAMHSSQNANQGESEDRGPDNRQEAGN